MHEGLMQAAGDEPRRIVLVFRRGEDGRVGLVPRPPPDPAPEEPEIQFEGTPETEPEPDPELYSAFAPEAEPPIAPRTKRKTRSLARASPLIDLKRWFETRAQVRTRIPLPKSPADPVSGRPIEFQAVTPDPAPEEPEVQLEVALEPELQPEPDPELYSAFAPEAEPPIAPRTKRKTRSLARASPLIDLKRWFETPAQVQTQIPSPTAPPAPVSGRLIEFQAVTLRFGDETAIHGLSLTIDAGELIAIVGPSGAGKTSTLRLLQGQIRPTSGALWIDGVPIHRAWPFRLRRLRRRIGVVFQDYRLLANRTALDNVAFALQVSDLSMPRSEARRRATEQLALVGLSKRTRSRPHELSGGQQQRVAIARALVTRPRILLADEPTASLDQNQARRVMRLFREVSDSGTTVLLATHDRNLVKGTGARIVSLSKGRVISDRPLRGERLWVVS